MRRKWIRASFLKQVNEMNDFFLKQVSWPAKLAELFLREWEFWLARPPFSSDLLPILCTASQLLCQNFSRPNARFLRLRRLTVNLGTRLANSVRVWKPRRDTFTQTASAREYSPPRLRRHTCTESENRTCFDKQGGYWEILRHWTHTVHSTQYTFIWTFHQTLTPSSSRTCWTLWVWYSMSNGPRTYMATPAKVRARSNELRIF